MSLDAKDREKLEKLLNMLGSDYEGERANAAGMIKKMADRYNVTPADLCLKTTGVGSSRASEHRADASRYSYGGQQARRAAPDESDFTKAWPNFGDDWRAYRAQERERQRQDDEAIRREQREAFHRRREEELREAGRRAAQERAKPKRVRKDFGGTYFGLLARLKAIYDNQFETAEDWKLDFIETVLRDCRADRQLTSRQRDMAKAILKYTEQDQEPLV